MTKPRVPDVDRYTLGHWCIGFVLGLWGVPATLALRISLGFERVEDVLKQVAPELFPVGLPDTRENSLNDTKAWMAGWKYARKNFPGEEAPIWQALKQRKAR